MEHVCERPAPYLACFARLRKVVHPRANEVIHEPIPLFDVALKGVTSGYRQCFRSLSTELSQYRTLFETYKSLDVDVLSSLSINEVIANLEGGKADYDPEERKTSSRQQALGTRCSFPALISDYYTWPSRPKPTFELSRWLNIAHNASSSPTRRHRGCCNVVASVVRLLWYIEIR